VHAVEPGDLLRIVVRILETQVLPATEEAARATLLLSVGILDNLSGRVEERRDLVTAREQRDRALVESVPERIRAGVDGAGVPVNRALSRYLRQLAEHPTLLTEPDVSAWLERCRQALLRQSAEEIALMRPTRYLHSQRSRS